MNYETEDYNAKRITPIKSLPLPLVVVEINKESYTPPRVSNGILYKVKVDDFVGAFREDNLSLIIKNESEPFFGGCFAFNGKSFLVESDTKIFNLSCKSLTQENTFDLDIVRSPNSIGLQDCFILVKHQDRSWGEPLSVVRKNIDDDYLLWSFTPDNSLSRLSVTEDESFVLVADSRGTIYLLDINTGKVVWQQDVQSLGALTLAELNHRELPSLSLHDNLHIYKDTISLGYLFNYMVGIDLHTGELKWKKKIDYGVAYTTVDANGRQYYLASHSQASTLYIIDCETGESIKEYYIDLSDEEIKSKFSSSVYSDVTTTHFWGVSQTGLLYAINLETGIMDWHYDLDSRLVHNPFFICNNRLYITTSAGQFIFEGQGGYLIDKI